MPQGGAGMEFIFMFTRDDHTVEDCLEVFDFVRETGVKHLGFKDVGVTRETLVALNDRIRSSGGISYMEVVSTTSEACLNSARSAVEIGVDRLLGGTEAEAMLEVLAGSGITDFPFAGRPEGHPTQLGGTPEQVAADCRHFEALGCAGVDLLAYRATEAEPLDLFYSRAVDWGDDYLVWQDEADAGACLPSAENELLDGFCNEFDAIEGSKLLASGEASITASPGGTFFYAIWNQIDFDKNGNEKGSDAWFRRVLFLDDYEIVLFRFWIR